MGEMCILSNNGDDKIVWDINNKTDIERAKKSFKNMKNEDYTFFVNDKNGKQRAITNFDSLAEFIICVPKTRKG